MIYLVVPSMIIIPILSTFVPKENGEFIKAGHAEVADNRPIFPAPPPPNLTPPIGNTSPTGHAVKSGHIDHIDDHHVKTEKVVQQMKAHDDGNVMFVPETRRRSDDGAHHNMRIDDVLSDKITVQDLAAGMKHSTTEPPPDPEEENIVFVSGKNHDPHEPPHHQEPYDHHEDARRNSDIVIEKPKKTEKPKIDCKNLNCENVIDSVCGGKVINNAWKYRLFMNECYFRKVNCAFRSESSRYEALSMDSCRNIGEHATRIPYYLSYYPPPPARRTYNMYTEESHDYKKYDNYRREFSSRRATSKDMNGFLCSHTCPVSCPDNYEPECAISSTGNRKVFLNHCKLDYNSCFYGVVWHRRPLAECVGGKKADMRQNRSFIGWMQRVGLVDGKGRLKFD